VERHDEGAEREVDESIQKTADRPFLSEHDEELDPNSRLEDMGQAYDEKEERGEFFDGGFHGAGLRRRAHSNKR
jgi:hypothetical protein